MQVFHHTETYHHISQCIELIQGTIMYKWYVSVDDDIDHFASIEFHNVLDWYR